MVREKKRNEKRRLALPILTFSISPDTSDPKPHPQISSSVCYSPYSYQRFQYRNLNPRLYNTISACVHISSQFFPILFPSSSFHLSIICRECRRLSIVTYIHISSYNIYISNILNIFWWWARDLLDVRICDGFFVSIHFVCFKASKMIDNDLNLKRIKIFIIIKSFILDTFVCYGIQTFAFL